MALAHTLGVPLAEGAAALAGFRGVARRFELRGEAAGVTFVDDYAHLPTEVAAVLAAAAAAAWRRVVAVFQPHRYTPDRERCGASSPTRSSTPTCWWSPTCTPPGRRPGPASRAS